MTQVDPKAISRENQRKKKRLAGRLYLAAAIVSLLTATTSFFAQNPGQGITWLGLSLVWGGLSVPLLRSRELASESSQPASGSDASDFPAVPPSSNEV